jgi:hydroxymethylbilane synthase
LSRLRLGTRASALARVQAEHVAGLLGDAEVIPVKTADGEPGDKARFVRGVEEALLAGDVDLGVHSAKDLPAKLSADLALAGVPQRSDPADAFVGPARSPAEIPAGARIGTSSLRRRSQLLAMRPDIEVVELRGNVDTRLRKLGDGDYDGIVLAAAGLRRLGRETEIAFRFDPEEMTPAAGQGTLALESRRGDEAAASAAASISDHDALVELTAERTVVAALAATCHTPIAIHARLDAGELRLAGYVGLPDGSEWVRDQVTGDADQPGALGTALSERLAAAGARELLERAEASA